MPKDNIARGLALKNQKGIKQIETNSYNPSNKVVLNKIDENEEGKLKYNGEIVGGTVDISGKVDKVTGATADNFAGIDANGNIKDSGKKADDFVTAEAGKGLSTEDYTTDEKSKLNGIEKNADVSPITAVQYNGAAVDVTNKTVDIAPNAYATPTVDGSTITLESNKEYNISLADDATIALPSAPGTTYSGTILLCLTCTADINLTFDASVKLDSGVSTDTGYHELLITFHPGESKWWVRQTPEVT